MRLGLMLSGARPAPDAVALAERAEQAGVAEVWVPEDYFQRGALAVAGAVATATQRVRLGLGVLNPWTRHPMLIAMETASLQELAPGRTVLGMGASNKVWMEDRCGVPFRKPLTALDESVAIIRAALRGDPVNHTGAHFLVDATLAFSPPGSSVPIYLGAKGRHALELSGRIADGVLLSLLSSPAYVTWARQHIGGAAHVGAYVLVACDDDPSAARDAVRPAIAHFLGIHGDHDITRVAGLDPTRAQEFRRAWVTSRPTVTAVDDDLVEIFAIAGDVAGCLRRLQQLDVAGVDCAVLCDPGNDGIEGVLRLIDAYRQSQRDLQTA